MQDLGMALLWLQLPWVASERCDPVSLYLVSFSFRFAFVLTLQGFDVQARTSTRLTSMLGDVP